MSAFDELDARSAAAIGRFSSELVKWRPQLVKAGGTYTVKEGSTADNTRPVRDLNAIVTWAPDLGGLGAGTGGGQVANAQLVVDFELSEFLIEPYAPYGKPKKGDHIELLEEPEAHNGVVEITRVGDDGSARIICFCTVVKGRAPPP